MGFLYRLGWLTYRVFYGVFGGVRASGREHVPPEGSFLICANHRSLLDPPAVGCTFGRGIGYMAKKELFKKALFRWILLRVNAIPVDRERFGRDTMRAILKLVQRGIPVLIFPEGTRSKTGVIADAKPGIGFLARNAGVSVLPAFIENTDRWPKTFGRRRRMTIHYGELLPAEWIASAPAGREGYQKIADEIVGRIRTLQQRVVGAELPAGTAHSGMADEFGGKINSTICPHGQI